MCREEAMTGQDWMDKDFYATLGVAKDADGDAIKKAYRKLARQYHPDQNQGDLTAEAKFKEVGEAYAVLSDPKERQQYDAIRSMAGGGARFHPGSGGGGFSDMFGGMFGGGGNPNVQFSGGRPGAGGAGFSDIFSMFGGGGGGFGGGRVRVHKGADLSAATTLPFRTAVQGAEIDLTVDGKPVKTRIPAGVNDGAKLRLRGKGRPGSGGGENGDLVLTVHVDKHPVYALDGKNLRITVPVTFAEAALGCKIDVPTLDGQHVTVKVPAGTPGGRVLRVKGRGVQGAKSNGDLLVTVHVTVPAKLNKQAKEALEALTVALGEGESGDLLRADLAHSAAK